MALQSVAIFAVLSPTIHPGPYSTTVQFAGGFVEAGSHPVALTIIEEETARGLVRMMARAAASRANIVIVRHIDLAGPLVLLLGLILRARRRIFVLQVPTPVSSTRLDRNHRRGALFHAIKRVVMKISHPIVFAVPHLILQFAPERGLMARVGANKTLLVSHPVEPSEFSLRKAVDPDRIRIVGVASSANYPGFDRLLRGLSEYQALNPRCAVDVVLVGPHLALEKELELARTLMLTQSVTFTGALFGAELQDVLSDADVACGTLAGHRVGLTVASPLKHRAYLAHGIPFITSIDDPGMPQNARWILKVVADDTPLDLVGIVEWAKALPIEDSRQQMRAWAETQMSAQSIAARILAEAQRLRNRKRAPEQRH